MKNREIKFRIWDGDSFFFPENCPAFGFVNEMVKVGRWDVQKKYHVEQFTGVQDKNDEDIYEGDIIEFYLNWWGELEANGIVEYDDEAAKFLIKGTNGGKNGAFDFVTPPEGYKVIGNIHENKNLLK